MKKPLIGLTPSHHTKEDDLSMRPTYLRAVLAAGGIPVVLPLEVSKEDLEQLTDTLDGVIFTGGPDIHPFSFGEETHALCGDVSIKRDNMEMSLLEIVMNKKKPILGICRGIQLINIALGGDIYQDLASQFPEQFPIAHKQPFAYKLYAHKVLVVEGSLLHRITGAVSLDVNSMHHQAVRRVAPCLTISGYGPNQLIEALEMSDYPYLVAVQWHPEHLWPEDDSSMKLFRSFIEACQCCPAYLRPQH